MSTHTDSASLRQLLSAAERPVRRPVRRQPPTRFSESLNRLISAAVVSPRFCRQLLSDPSAALATGYNGERFHLTSEEMRLVCSIRATSLRTFAAQLVDFVQEPVSDLRTAWAGDRQFIAGSQQELEHAAVPIAVARI